jgi:hypothetical protein
MTWSNFALTILGARAVAPATPAVDSKSDIRLVKSGYKVLCVGSSFSRTATGKTTDDQLRARSHLPTSSEATDLAVG